MGDNDKPEEMETIVSWFLLVVTVVAGICLGTHFTHVEREPEVTLPIDVAQLQSQLVEERLAKLEALDRLSAIVASRVIDGNSDIVDLSDPNRPEKIGVMFSELYNNEWTDAYDVLHGKFNRNENKVLGFLHGILQLCFKACKKHAEEELEMLRDTVKVIEADITKKHTRLSGDLMQRIKEERKLSGTDKIPKYHEISGLKVYFSKQSLDAGLMEQDDIKAYIMECLRVCRLMVIQDPPMTLLFKPGATNLKEQFSAYQQKGTQIDIVVWPALFLKEGGPLVNQGIVKYQK